jgi:protein-tyrosine-phosphatase
MATALFVCRQNAGRSQMSAAFFEQAAAGRHQALSAGTTPAERVHPEVVHVMRELDIDLADRVPRPLTRDLAQQADVVVTMGCGDECPYIPGKRYIDWDLQDPAGRPLDEVPPPAMTSRAAPRIWSPTSTEAADPARLRTGREGAVRQTPASHGMR